MKIAAITSAGACGIADYSDQLAKALTDVDPSIEVVSNPEWLDPERFWNSPGTAVDVVWLNHHAALHARWLPEHVLRLQQMGKPVVATLHDTRAGDYTARNSEQLLGLYEVCAATVVHEPVVDMLKAHYIRHGVPKPFSGPEYGQGPGSPFTSISNVDYCFKGWRDQPVLGTVGFDFPWKNYDRLLATAAEADWAVVLLANNATAEREAYWRTINPNLLCIREFIDQSSAISFLSGCDATAFTYECANNGTSGAIRQGLAARKPLYAFLGCRQFRDVIDAEQTQQVYAVRWIKDFRELRYALTVCPIQRIDPGVAFLAHVDSWPNQAMKYLDVFRSVLA